MGVNSYEKNGKVFWKVYIDIRSRQNRQLRLQKRLSGFETEKEAQIEDRRQLRELTARLSCLEGKGMRWRDVIDRWETYQELYPSGRYVETTYRDYCSSLRKWTSSWLDKMASDINRGDGREMIRFMQEEGKNAKFCKGIKNAINTIYKWGIEEKLINGVHLTPVHDVDIERDREEKMPEILTLEEIRALLRKAREQNHPWYPVWVGASLTGCRSGELQELRKSDLEIISREQAFVQDKLPIDKRRYGQIRVRRNWNARAKKIGPTKAGYWRTVPISGEFYRFLIHEIKIETLEPNTHVFPRFRDWILGFQAQVLRAFCIANGIPSVRFHTLRACFATQLISTGIPGTVVMKICGWKDLKTMQRYIRLAGIDEGGATENLQFLPTEEAAMEKVVSLLEFKQKET